MKTINLNDRVKYLGNPNSWTFKQDLERNSVGRVVRIFSADNKMIYEIKFDNGILTTIDIGNLEIKA